MKNELGFNCDDLRHHAVRMRRRWNDSNPELESEDDSQEAALRYLQGGGILHVEQARGTARALAGEYLRLVQLERSRKSSRFPGAIPEEVVDVSALLPSEVLAELANARRDDRRRRFLETAWELLTPKRRLALVRIEGPMFGLNDNAKPTKADHTAACLARKTLRKMAKDAGLMDNSSESDQG